MNWWNPSNLLSVKIYGDYGYSFNLSHQYFICLLRLVHLTELLSVTWGQKLTNAGSQGTLPVFSLSMGIPIIKLELSSSHTIFILEIPIHFTFQKSKTGSNVGVGPMLPPAQCALVPGGNVYWIMAYDARNWIIYILCQYHACWCPGS